MAQQPAATGRSTELATDSDIVVTARRREERLLDVPITVSALSSAALERQNVTDTRDLAINTPSLRVSPTAKGGTGNYISLRGLGGTETLFGQDQTVGLYIDEVPLSRQDVSNLALYDLANVQVLYGPQGTLFGRNTVAGAVVYTSRRPSDKFEGYGKLEYGSFNHQWLTAALNVPVGETLAIRVAGQVRRRDGYLQIPNSSYEMGSLDSDAIRATVRWHPAPGITNDLIVSYSRADQVDLGRLIYGTKAVAAAPCNFDPANFSASLANIACYYGPGAPVPLALAAVGAITPATLAAYQSWPTVAQSVAQNLTGYYLVGAAAPPLTHDTAFSLTNTTEIPLGENAKLRNIAGYRRIVALSQSAGLGLAVPGSVLLNTLRQRQYSDELQLQASLFANQMNLTAAPSTSRRAASNPPPAGCSSPPSPIRCRPRSVR